ncbi:hypothetical protein [Candidatus Mesenet endosymbiont of Agriotes lineatus]|uniref:hypothetical protein n=1 Tax=Candidatus Mesenet endosymbiont of Agriotes lineatus TaxID=3077948 RepID=UPI0030D405A6
MNEDTTLHNLKDKCLSIDETLNEISKDLIVLNTERNEQEMKEYLDKLINKYETLCGTLQEIGEDLKKLSTKRNEHEVTQYLDDLKDKHSKLEKALKTHKSSLLTAQSYVEEPIKGLDKTGILDNVMDQYKKLSEEYKRSCLTSDVIMLKTKISECGKKRNSFLKSIQNTILNLWNSFISCFCFSTDTREMSTQSYEGKESTEDVKKGVKEKLDLRDKKVDTSSKCNTELEGASVDSEGQSGRLNEHQRSS